MMTLRTLSTGAALLAGLSFVGVPASAQVDTITLSPRAFPVGKWAEGLAFAGGSLWVAEGGQRTIAQLDLDNRVVRRITVGRLPTQMTVHTDGAIYTAVITDKLIWQQFPKAAQGRAIRLRNGCPTRTASGDQHLWVLSVCDGRTSVIRLEPRGGDQSSSRVLTGAGVDIVAHRGQVWVAHFNKTNALSVIDEQTMAVRTPAIQGSFGALTASGDTVYAAGVTNSGQEVVISIHPTTLQEQRRQVVDQRILFMADDDQHVVAVGRDGKLWVFSANNLELQRVINLRIPNFFPRAALLIGDDLYLTSQEQQGSQNGAVHVLTGWRPAAAARAPAPATPGPVQGMPGAGQGGGSSQGAPSAAAPAMPGAAQGMPSAAPAVPSAAPAMPSAAPAVPGAAPATAETACPYRIANVAAASVVWLYEDPDSGARKIVAVPSDARGLVADRCLRDWCHVAFRGANGWIEKSNIQPTCN